MGSTEDAKEHSRFVDLTEIKGRNRKSALVFLEAFLHLSSTCSLSRSLSSM